MKISRVFLLIALATLMARLCRAHPGSAIVVDQSGVVYFSDFGRGVGKINRDGGVSYIGNTRGGHWLCLDPDGVFARTQPKHFERITADGVKPALIYADGGSPIAVAGGMLYFASNDQKMEPGALQLTRQSPNGQISIFPANGKTVTGAHGITGLAAGPGGSVYIAQPDAILKLRSDGTITNVANPVKVADCDVDYPDHNPRSLMPSIRGLAVSEDGAVFAAAVGCRAVIKVSTAGVVTTVLKAESPWSPTAVAVQEGAAYVLEYTNANGNQTEGWRCRVRKLGSDGKVVVLYEAAQAANGGAK